MISKFINVAVRASGMGIENNILIQWCSYGGGGWGFEHLFVANVTSYFVTFTRILQNLDFIYPI